ncbi:B3 domain-containing protein [Cephalotus follicularis]|uniref:B3 domain-containing protein n=1 Tax=Cephalotus follicularis TaxID=3775 RepID=A0A1Q3BTE9_CEPFO|nr:B3 domain-containing protein [Cephalotus follicularis]
MENLYTPFSNTSTTDTTAMTNLRQPNIGCFINETTSYPSPSTQFYYTAPHYNYMPTHETLQNPYTYPIQQPDTSLALPMYPFMQNGIQDGLQSPIHGSSFLQQNVSLMQQEKKSIDAYKTKLARIKRKQARQKSIRANKNSSASSSTSSTQADVNERNNEGNRDLYKFFTPDDKRLRVLLKKELKNSDVGSLGRIVLPKREAEENLPILTDKEGIGIVLRDLYSIQEWSFKFKYWSNNKSRMYVLENTGKFVRQNGLEMGDSLTLYEDESKHLYFSIKKTEKPTAEPLYEQHYANQNNNYLYTPTSWQARDEEEASLALLIEQLKHKEHQEVNNLMALDCASSSSYMQTEEAQMDLSKQGTFTLLGAASSMQHSYPWHGNLDAVNDCQLNVDDYYGGLGMLPDRL